MQETKVNDTSASTSTSDDSFQNPKVPTAGFVDKKKKNAREKLINESKGPSIFKLRKR